MKLLVVTFLLMAGTAHAGASLPAVSDASLEQKLMQSREEVVQFLTDHVRVETFKECPADFSIIPEIYYEELNGLNGQFRGFEKHIRIDPSMRKDSGLEATITHEYTHHVLRKLSKRCLSEYLAQIIEEGSE